jgi:hypothetical protein
MVDEKKKKMLTREKQECFGGVSERLGKGSKAIKENGCISLDYSTDCIMCVVCFQVNA